MKYKTYISLDTETTGLTDQDQILQIGLIIDDLVTPIEQLKKLSFLVDNSQNLYTGYLDPTALHMNSWIFKALSGEYPKQSYPIYEHSKAIGVFHDFLAEVANRTGSSIIFAGKNIGTFDLRLLKANRFLDDTILQKRGIIISHRTIDTGSLYFPDFGYVPTANEINESIGRKKVTHDALEDALDVVCAIRTKLGVGI